MPVDLQRPKKIPVGDKGDLKSFTADKADDGSWILTCYHGGDGDMMGKPTKYTAKSTGQLMSMLRQKISGDSSGGVTTPTTPKTPPTVKVATVKKPAAPPAAPALAMSDLGGSPDDEGY